MSRARIYLRNLSANWFAYGANLLVVFFMSPYVIHKLGDVQYGVWTLMMSLTGYLGIVELGTRAGLGRFINYYLGKRDFERVNAVISTGLAIFALVGVVLLIAAGGLAAVLSVVFPKIPSEFISATRLITPLVAMNLWVSFVSTPFQQVLTAHERFDISNGLDLLVLACRIGGTIVLLEFGLGLVSLALLHLASSVLGWTCVRALASRVFPPLRVRPRLVSAGRFREIFGFSIWAFISSVGYRLQYGVGAVVIGIVLGPEWITYYAVGGMLLIKVRDALSRSMDIFFPKMVQDCARGDWQALRMQFYQANSLAMGIGILLLVGMIAFGREFILLWMGTRFEISYSVLAILSSSWLLVVGFSGGAPIFSGLDRIRLLGVLNLAQGLANLVLTLLLVIGFQQGIQGVAWGTFFPRVVFEVLGGLIVMRWIDIPFHRYLATIASRWAGLATCFYAACTAVNLMPFAHSWPLFLLKVTLATIVYLPLAWVLLLDANGKAWVRRVAANRLRADFARLAVRRIVSERCDRGG